MASQSTKKQNHEQPDKQAHTLMSTRSTVSQNPSGMTPNNIKITQVSPLPRPSTITTTEDSINEINSKLMKGDKYAQCQ